MLERFCGFGRKTSLFYVATGTNGELLVLGLSRVNYASLNDTCGGVMGNSCVFSSALFCF